MARLDAAGRERQLEQDGVAHQLLEIDLVTLDGVGLALDRCRLEQLVGVQVGTTMPSGIRARCAATVTGPGTSAALPPRSSTVADTVASRRAPAWASRSATSMRNPDMARQGLSGGCKTDPVRPVAGRAAARWDESG
jgi:hypothetical protein